MAVLYIVIPIALILAGAGLAAFLWSVRKGQFDDLDSAAVRMLFEDEEPGSYKNIQPIERDGQADP